MVEFRPGVGGGESMIFAEEMMNAYKSYAIQQGWRFEVISINKDTSFGKGIKTAFCKITGNDCYVKMK